jgi:predicted CxxxxCH...CXXCH cytochrome family protein
VKYGFGCANCHPVGPTAEATYHINGTVEVVLDATSGGTYASALRKLNTTGTAGYVSGTGCDLVYCHSDGKNTMVANGNGHAPAWNYVFTTAERCARCHGNSPTTAAHNAHQVGIHYNDIFSGTSGKLSAVATGPSSHGNATQSTTITCNTCHYKTVTASGNDQNTLCKSCHTGAGHLQGDMKIGNLSFHVNGKKEVSFKPSLQVVSKAQLRDSSFSNYSGVWVRNGGRINYKTGATAFDTAKVALTDTMWNAGAGTCANIACHNLRTGQTVTWTDTTVDCQSCHSKL